MRILFIRQPTVYSIPVLGLGMGIIATILKNAGYDVKVIDNNSIYYKVYSDRELINTVKDFNPHIVAFNLTIINALATYTLLAKIRNKFPDIIYVGGGLHMKYCSNEALEKGFDIIVPREGEKTTLPLFEYLSHRRRRDFRKELATVAGVSFIREEGGLHIPTDYPAIENLDEVPFVDYSLFNLKDFLKTGNEPAVIELNGQRGCPFTCTFCSDDILRADKRVASADYMFRYTEYLHNLFGVHYLFLNDNNFTFPRQRAIDFCQKMIRSGLNKKMAFACQTKVETPLDEDVVINLKQAGCCNVGLGIERLESYSQDMIRKKSSIERIREVVNLLKKHKIQICIFMMAGFPFETVEILKKERRAFLEFVKKVKSYNLSILMPTPGTIYYDSYPKVKEWYLNPSVMKMLHSYYGQVFDLKMFDIIKINFFNLSKKVCKELIDYVIEFKRINHKNFVIKKTFFVYTMNFLDSSIAHISRLFFYLSLSLESFVFKWVRYMRYYFATRFFGRKIKEAQ